MEVLNIQQLKEMANPVIQIPSFDNTGTINIRVQKPRLLDMARQGKIPNHLIGVANDMLLGKKKDDTKKKNKEDEALKYVGKMVELYARACLVEPTYDEFKDLMTDEQGDAIYAFAIREVSVLDSFREDGQNGADNADGEEVQPKA